MKLELSIIVIVVGTVVTTAAAPNAHADVQWKCQYTGSWVTTKTKNTSPLNLALDWDLAEQGWKIRGTSSDKDGSAELVGGCQGNDCSFVQTYKSGKLSGKTYFWAGLASPNNANKTSTGTWGYTSADRANGGTWQATSTCARPSAPPVAKPTSATTATKFGAMFQSHGMSAFSTDKYFVLGGCIDTGAGMACSATLATPQGKLVKNLSAETSDDMGNGGDRKQLDKLIADLDKLVGDADLHPLDAHDLTKASYTQEDGTFTYDAKANTLAIKVKSKTKKVAGPKVPKGMRVDAVKLYLFGAGSPPAAILSLEMSEIEGAGTTHASVTFPIPEIGGGD